ncbi:MAG TPA: NAD-dependent malic enzyme [Proteobacteria bacterium]|nr:NAD-dependent malic enzyme [Pseudomonadota bacterium]
MIYELMKDKKGAQIIKTSLRGKALMFHPLLNKSNAFSKQEREAFGLIGKLPPTEETLETQVERAYKQYHSCVSDEAKSIYLHVLYNTNETLFYALITKHIAEVTEKLYTPTVSTTVQQYSLQYRHPRGLFISYDDEARLDDIIANRTNTELDTVVISDGEAILGIGDQGIGGMGIPVAKAAMHVAAGMASPYKIAPIFIDMGTNKTALHNNPFYLGRRSERISGKPYQEFMSKIIDRLYKKFPNLVIHFEDFSKTNARWLMERYGEQKPCFNDDIQGTAVIVLSAIIAALSQKNESIADQRIVLVGPGAAGMGIIETIAAYFKSDKKSINAADNIWLVGRDGLITEDTVEDDAVKIYAKSREKISDWPDKTLCTIVEKVKPTILIGVTGQGNLFDKNIIQTMYDHCKEPIILPLSNPSDKAECIPSEVIERTEGNVYIASGSPFTYTRDSELFNVSQCNNLFAFPGIAAGMVAAQARHLSQEMIIAASVAIASFTTEKYGHSRHITPELEDLPEVSQLVAMAIIKETIIGREGGMSLEDAVQNLSQNSWLPHYIEYYYDREVE